MNIHVPMVVFKMSYYVDAVYCVFFGGGVGLKESVTSPVFTLYCTKCKISDVTTKWTNCIGDTVSPLFHK